MNDSLPETSSHTARSQMASNEKLTAKRTQDNGAKVVAGYVLAGTGLSFPRLTQYALLVEPGAPYCTLCSRRYFYIEWEKLEGFNADKYL